MILSALLSPVIDLQSDQQLEVSGTSNGVQEVAPPEFPVWFNF